MQENLIKTRIQEVLPDAQIQLSTLDGVHYAATVKSARFQGLKRLEQHRLVMNALKDILETNEVHALALKTEVL